MAFEDRRKPGNDNRRARGRGGRRKTDRRAETVTAVDCEHCDGGSARLCEVSTGFGGLTLTYRCARCGEHMQRPSCAPDPSRLGSVVNTAPGDHVRPHTVATEANDGKKDAHKSADQDAQPRR